MGIEGSLKLFPETEGDILLNEQKQSKADIQRRRGKSPEIVLDKSPTTGILNH